jgi:ribonuclease HI
MDKPRIEIYTDASVDPGRRGAGLGYYGEVFFEDGSSEDFDGDKFIGESITSTQAESLAAAHGLKSVYDYLDGDTSDYEIKIYIDCTRTIKEIKGELESELDTGLIIEMYLRRFKDQNVFYYDSMSQNTAHNNAQSAQKRGCKVDDV